MKSKIELGKWGIIWILVNMICTKIFLNFPRVTAETAGPAGWILTIYVSIVAFILFFFILKLYKPFINKDLLDMGEYIGGNLGRIVVGLVLISFFMFIVSIVLREFAEDMKIIGYNASPISYILLFFVAGVIASAYFGLEAISRLITIGAPIISVIFVLLLISTANYYDFSNLTPVLGNGINSIFGTGILRVSFFAEFIVIFMLAPYIKSFKDFKSAGFYGLGISSFYLTFASLVFLLVFPYPSNTEGFLPIYQLARLINIGRFFQRVESIFVLIWVFAAIHYLSVGFFMIIYIFKKTFKLEYYRPIIIPFIIIIYTLSLIPKSLVASVKLNTVYFNYFAGSVTFIFPILILLVARILQKSKKEKSLEKK